MQRGRSLTLGILRSGQWFGELPAVGAAKHTHHAFTKGATRVGVVDQRAIEALLEKHVKFCRALLDWQSMRTNSMIHLLEEHATLDLPARMARQIQRLAKDHGTPHGHGELKIELPLQQSELADMAGCSRQRSNQRLVDLVRRGVIRYVSGAHIVADLNALEALCN
jgi:CRP-like cAMP-binding protein